MTVRLYYTDARLRAFDATVTSCRGGAGRYDVTLDETAFYPTSGGQPHDAGVLGGQPLLDVVEAEDGSIVHVVAGPLDSGVRVAGEIDWPRRFDHMQQHTGQHVLSAAFDRRAGARTVSFHMGEEVSTIDLARGVSAAEITGVESLANEVVWEDRPVHVRFVDAEEAARLPLRKESQRTGTLRLVDVDRFDLSACGGTHVSSTGMIGAIAVTGWERLKAGTRVSFACGGRALRSHARLRDIADAAARLLSVPAVDLPGAIARLQADGRASAKLADHLEEELSTHIAAALRRDATAISGVRVVLREQPGAGPAALKRLAAAIAAEPGFAAVLVGDGQPAPVAVARARDVELDAGAWIRQAVAALGGRGGGRPEQAQGAIAASADNILAFARASLAPVTN